MSLKACIVVESMYIYCTHIYRFIRIFKFEYLHNIIEVCVNSIVHEIQSVPYHIGLSLRFKDKNTHIILENPSIICKKNFTMALYDFF